MIIQYCHRSCPHECKTAFQVDLNYFIFLAATGFHNGQSTNYFSLCCPPDMMANKHFSIG